MSYAPKALQALVEAASPPDLELRFRTMFGGIMGYADGQAFASLSNVGLALKMSGAEYVALSALPATSPISPQQKLSCAAGPHVVRSRQSAILDRSQRRRPKAER